jgi:hypothetical protein
MGAVRREARGNPLFVGIPSVEQGSRSRHQVGLIASKLLSFEIAGGFH